MSCGRRGRPGGRLCGVIAATLAVAAMIVPLGAHAPTAAAAVTTLSLRGEGSWDPSAELVAWETGVSNATGGAVSTSSYIPNGDGEGVQDFISTLAAGLTSGSQDYAISGVPLQPADLAKVPGGANGVVAVPIMPSGLQFLFAPPSQGFEVVKTNPNDGSLTNVPYGPPGEVAPGKPIANCPAGGSPAPVSVSDPTAACPPINVPPTNLVAMMDGDSTTDPASTTDPGGGVPQDYFGDPSILATWDQAVLNYNPTAGDIFAAGPFQQGPDSEYQLEPNDDNYYLQEWATAAASSEWKHVTTSAKNPNPGPIGESFPGTFEPYGALGLTSLLAAFESNSSPAGGLAFAQGFIAPAPPSGKYLVETEETQYFQAHPTTLEIAPTPENIQVQNAEGQWMSPTPSAIEAEVNAAAAAGRSACSSTNANALYALSNKVPNAYPLSWVDCLYAPAKGLTMSQTNALAGLIRYLVTDGQQQLHPDGDGKLPSAYVAQALAGANTVVTDNCPGAGGQVVLTASPTTYSPDSPGVRALGNVDECVTPTPVTVPSPSKSPVTTPANRVPLTTTTTTTNTTTTTPLAFSSSPQTGSSTSVTVAAGATAPKKPTSSPQSSRTVPAATKPPATLPTTKPTSVISARLAANLPYSLGSASLGIDKLSALLLGALLFLLGRRLVRWIAKAWAR